MQFRQKALARLGALSEIDAPVKLVRPNRLMLLVVVTILVVGGVVWACIGSIPRTAGASGILTHADGSFSLQSPVSGQITGVFVQQGDTFPTQTAMFAVQVGSYVQTIRSVSGGRAIAVLGSVGQVITAGTQLAIVEMIANENDPLVAVLYVTQDNAGLIADGDDVDLTVQSAPSAQYGVLRGVVQSISQFPETEQQIADFLGDPQLGNRFSAEGQPLQVIVRLIPGQTVSGFQWSSRQGPPFPIDSRTLVGAAFQLPSVRPLSWVVS
jgi:biotin carboxyl carrier protein